MPPRREDVDLFLVLTDPKCARNYVKHFEWELYFEEVPKAVTTETGRRIEIENMDDQEAVVLASELCRKYEVKAAEADLLIAEAVGQVC